MLYIRNTTSVDARGSRGSHEGVSFSAGDISFARLLDNKEGSSMIVEAGTNRSALVIMDTEKAADFFKNNDAKTIQKNWNKAFDAAAKADPKAGFQSHVNSANKAVLKGSGIGFFQTNDKDKLKFEEVK